MEGASASPVVEKENASVTEGSNCSVNGDSVASSVTKHSGHSSVTEDSASVADKVTGAMTDQTPVAADEDTGDACEETALDTDFSGPRIPRGRSQRK